MNRMIAGGLEGAAIAVGGRVDVAVEIGGVVRVGAKVPVARGGVVDVACGKLVAVSEAAAVGTASAGTHAAREARTRRIRMMFFLFTKLILTYRGNFCRI